MADRPEVFGGWKHNPMTFRDSVEYIEKNILGASERVDRICAEVERMAEGMPNPTLSGGDKGLANLVYMNMLKQYKDDQMYLKEQTK